MNLIEFIIIKHYPMIYLCLKSTYDMANLNKNNNVNNCIGK